MLWFDPVDMPYHLINSGKRRFAALLGLSTIAGKPSDRRADERGAPNLSQSLWNMYGSKVHVKSSGECGEHSDVILEICSFEISMTTRE